MKNLRIKATSAGEFKAGDVVPAYAFGHADWLVNEGLAEWTGDRVTVEVSADSLKKGAPDASADLAKAHADTLAKATRLEDTVDSLHARVLDLEANADALAKENAAKVVELAEAKAERDAARVEVEKLKAENATLDALLTEADKAKDAKPEPPKK
jgi:chromosome segregation ATPase